MSLASTSVQRLIASASVFADHKDPALHVNELKLDVPLKEEKKYTSVVSADTSLPSLRLAENVSQDSSGELDDWMTHGARGRTEKCPDFRLKDDQVIFMAHTDSFPLASKSGELSLPARITLRRLMRFAPSRLLKKALAADRRP
ncbi:hypothetical protein [Bradyrhizobium yuanmingense]|uniref:hypothetical protein n=1 Tax=Bradyrhizobium yuanmingense TaxID=108015 RepID=UPI0023B8980B|nr:hypothetical protein [Bradyrhizobium yuanmingense]MDF0499071.1 hypothetical protein [Bradyrhizobium yuanmingense]